MSRVKKQISLLLCILLAVPAVLGCLPGAKLTAQAANVSFNWVSGVIYQWESGQFSARIKTEEKQNFEIGNLIRAVDGENQTFVGALSGVTYRSSNNSVASVGSKTGKVSTKKPGSVSISITYKGRTTVCKLTVVKKGSLGMGSSQYKTLKKQADTVSRVFGKRITSANRYKISNQLSSLRLNNRVNESGFRLNRQGTGNAYTTTNELVVPSLAKTCAIREQLKTYVDSNNPVGVKSGRQFRVSSVTAKNNSRTFTVQLKSAVTSTQIFALKENTAWDTYRTPSNSERFPIYVENRTNGQRYYGLATAVQGSKKMMVTMYNLKLQKGTVYVLYGAENSVKYPGTWTQAKAFRTK